MRGEIMTLGVEISRMPRSTVVESCELSGEVGHFVYPKLRYDADGG